MSTASESKVRGTVSTGKAHKLAQGKASCCYRVHGKKQNKVKTTKVRYSEKLRGKKQNSTTLELHLNSETRGEDDRLKASED